MTFYDEYEDRDIDLVYSALYTLESEDFDYRDDETSFRYLQETYLNGIEYIETLIVNSYRVKGIDAKLVLRIDDTRFTIIIRDKEKYEYGEYVANFDIIAEVIDGEELLYKTVIGHVYISKYLESVIKNVIVEE